MADFAKLKRRTLSSPPPPDEASTNLAQPEHAPAPQATLAPMQPEPASRLDGRSMRRSNRIVPFATRVTPEFDQRIRNVAHRDNLLMVELLERALEAYERSKIAAR